MAPNSLGKRAALSQNVNAIRRACEYPRRQRAPLNTVDAAILFEGHQPFPCASEPQLNPKCRGEKDVDFARLNFLEISSGNLGSFGQFILRQGFANPLSSHIRAKHLNSRPLVFGYSHDILHRFESKILNDTYIVKKTCHPLGKRCRNATRLEKRAAWYRRHTAESEMPSRKRRPEVSRPPQNCMNI
jgi:hypothetical protein